MEVISTCFEMRWPGSDILSASEGRKGMELVESESPDVVLLDIGLPDIDGLRFCARFVFSPIYRSLS